ncbi:MAG: Inosine-uridine preferring nucleoside hydrolase, partial [Armatimonadetes bacterium]|nr:Inosine-uridine preferring nucleoside hydrolase [Armatimonadota bacterium]
PNVVMKPLSRRNFLTLFLVIAALGAGIPRSPAAAKPMKIPVILDTDIGDDIDDTWALGMLLRSPELDLKLVVSDDGKPLYRSKILAKFLQAAGRTDVPVGVGIDTPKKGEGGQSEWVRDYNLNRYPGKVYADGVQAMIDTIMSSREPITVIAIGPLPTLAAALEREPRIATKAKFVGMHGSVRVGYGGSKTPSAEYNVKQDVAACQKVFTAPWPMTITPLDTCGTIDLQGERYQRIRQSKDPIAAAITENYRLWSGSQKRPAGQADPFETRSSTLFDTVAIYLAFATDLVKMEEIPLAVTAEGMTAIKPGAHPVNVATEWKSLDGFRDLLVERLTNGKRK